MAREPSAHYKAIAAEVEMLRKRENSNMKRIRALEDEVKSIREMLRETLISGVEVNPEIRKPGKDDYDKLRLQVKQSRPELISLWDIYMEFGFASYRTVSAIMDNHQLTEEISAEIDGITVSSPFADEAKAREAIRNTILKAVVKIDYDESDNYQSASLVSVKASTRKGSAGNFKIPANTPESWIASIAKRELLREAVKRQLLSVFCECYAATYGRALGMDINDCENLVMELIRDGLIIRDENFIKTAR